MARQASPRVTAARSTWPALTCAPVRGRRLARQPPASHRFATTTAVLRRLLDPPGAPLLGADVVVEWGLARRLAAPRPRDVGVAWWAARYELRTARSISRRHFDPPPAVDAAHLIVWPRPGAYGAAVCVLCALLHAGYAAPGNRLGAVLRAFVPRGIAGRALGVCGLTASTPAGAMAAEQWYRLALALGRTPSVRWPSLPKRLTGRQLVRLRE